MDIKEIALKVAGEIYDVNFDEHKPSGKRLISFAEALIAEIAKQNEPVAFTNSAQLGYVTSGQHQDIPLAMWSRNTSYSGADIPLYTFPPTAEQIANETAEAIAKMLDDAEVEETHYCMNTYEEGKKFQFDMVEAILNGAWKDFKK